MNNIALKRTLESNTMYLIHVPTEIIQVHFELLILFFIFLSFGSNFKDKIKHQLFENFNFNLSPR